MLYMFKDLFIFIFLIRLVNVGIVLVIFSLCDLINLQHI